MARIVRHEATDPIKIDPASWPRDAEGNLKKIFICACGISKTFPFCDGTHKTCIAEDKGKTYQYDPATGQRSDATTTDTPSDIHPEVVPNPQSPMTAN